MNDDRAEQIILMLAGMLNEIESGRVQRNRLSQIGRELDRIEFELDLAVAR